MTEQVRALRARFAAGFAPETTAGLAPGHVQANLAVVPRAVADDFVAWCRANPKPCPVLGVGGRAIPALGIADIARELPRYRVFRDGAVTDTPTDVASLWHDDLVSVALGCSYSFDEALINAGVRMRPVEEGRNPPIYATSLETHAVGPFGGAVIASMRPIRREEVARAVAVTARYPLAHGAPIHVGEAAAIGIDPDRPLNGSTMRAGAGEVAVYWACGVTPECALQQARLPFAITHFPGAMLLTDLKLDALIDRDSP